MTHHNFENGAYLILEIISFIRNLTGDHFDITGVMHDALAVVRIYYLYCNLGSVQ